MHTAFFFFSVCQSGCESVCLRVSRSARLYFGLPACCLSARLSVSQSVSVLVGLSVFLFVCCLHAVCLSVCDLACLCVGESVSPYFSLPAYCLSARLSVPDFRRVSMLVCLYFCLPACFLSACLSMTTKCPRVDRPDRL